MLLKISQAAETLAISPKHFRREFVNTGKIEVIRLGKGPKGDRIHPDNLHSLIEARRETRCCIKGGESGGLSLGLKATSFKDPLGQPARERLR